MMKKLILAVVLPMVTWSYNSPSYGQTPQAKEPAVIVDEFFKAFSEGKFGDAADTFFKTNPWMEEKQTLLDSIKAKYASLPSAAGKYIGFKVIKTETAENISRIKAAAYFDRQPIVLTFDFYKTGEVWRGQKLDVNFDDAFDEILKSAEKQSNQATDSTARAP